MSGERLAHVAEGGIAGIENVPIGRVGAEPEIAQVAGNILGVIQYVEGIAAQFDAEPVANREALRQCSIEVVYRVPAQVVGAARDEHAAAGLDELSVRVGHLVADDLAAAVPQSGYSGTRV